jgi:hypothetical protein
MDEKMKNLQPLQEKVTTLEEIVKEHGVQQAALEAMIDRVNTTHNQQHHALNVVINRVEVAHNAPGGVAPPKMRKRWGGTAKDEEEDADNDFMPTNSNFLSLTAPVIPFYC